MLCLDSEYFTSQRKETNTEIATVAVSLNFLINPFHRDFELVFKIESKITVSQMIIAIIGKIYRLVNSKSVEIMSFIPAGLFEEFFRMSFRVLFENRYRLIEFCKRRDSVSLDETVEKYVKDGSINVNIVYNEVKKRRRVEMLYGIVQTLSKNAMDADTYDTLSRLIAFQMSTYPKFDRQVPRIISMIEECQGYKNGIISYHTRKTKLLYCLELDNDVLNYICELYLFEDCVFSVILSQKRGLRALESEHLRSQILKLDVQIWYERVLRTVNT